MQVFAFMTVDFCSIMNLSTLESEVRKVRVSCGVPKALATDDLVDRLKALGIEPIITSEVIRAVYQGPDRYLGEAIVEIYIHEADHDITVFYDKAEQNKSTRRAERKLKKAERNAKLHGH